MQLANVRAIRTLKMSQLVLLLLLLFVKIRLPQPFLSVLE